MDISKLVLSGKIYIICIHFGTLSNIFILIFFEYNSMWKKIEETFKNRPSQFKVVRELYKKGFKIDAEGKVCAGSIKIPHVQLAKSIGVDRRVVDEATKIILDDVTLKKIFMNLDSIPFLKNVASYFGMSVLIVTAEDADQPGLLSRITQILAIHKVNIRQAVAKDPEIDEQPKLYMMVDGTVPPDVIVKIREMKGIKSVTLQ